MKRNLSPSLAIVFGFFTIILNSQIALKETSLEEQIGNSSLVIEGKVINKESFWNENDGLIYTTNTIEVYKVFKGQLISKIDVITLGGTVGLKALIAFPSLKLNVDDIGVFALENSVVINPNSKQQSNKNTFKPYGSLQGFYKYNLRDDLAVNPFNIKQGIKSILYQDIIKATGNNYTEILAFDVQEIQTKSKLNQEKGLLPPSNLTLDKSIVSAGTKDVLTITGSGFGMSQGKVWFSNADDGGATYVSALDTEVLTWNDTSIIVQVPSTAGTGPIFIEDSSNIQSPLSSTLTVSYAETNVIYNPGSGDEAFVVQHFNENNSGGYTWDMQTDFFNDTEHPGAKAAFENAFNEWVCQTGINWTISGTPTTTDVIGVADLFAPFDGELDDDDENIIRFDNENELDTNILGVCYSWYGSCNGTDWLITSLDIVFDSETNWYFGSGSVGGSQYDFQSVALHELGHGHQLSHVIDPVFNGNNNDDVMHYSISNGEQQRVLTANNITAATNVQTRSTGLSLCGSPMTNANCPLSVEEFELKNAITLYPNPAKTQFFIKNESYIILEKVVIFDLSGRLVSEHRILNSSKSSPINLKDVSKGVYFVKIHSETSFITKKLVVH
ncbi:T9SS type A sorting domain-containing protein [Litoribaculum gwangyangense]|uniref:T9SS type A sorting domain-containing protein n=1 Tax=Litoribaculum gwangyangense TaxID=1130722 RepID=A0ABP9C5R8_9FLAO